MTNRKHLLANLRIEDVPHMLQAAVDTGFVLRAQAAFHVNGWPMAGYKAIYSYTEDNHAPLWARYNELRNVERV